MNEICRLRLERVGGSSIPLKFKLQSVHDHVGCEVSQECDREQQDTDQKEYMIVRAAEYHFSQLSGDGGSDGASGLQDVAGNDTCVSARHQDYHCLADGTPE